MWESRYSPSRAADLLAAKAAPEASHSIFFTLILSLSLFLSLSLSPALILRAKRQAPASSTTTIDDAAAAAAALPAHDAAMLCALPLLHRGTYEVWIEWA